MPGVEGIGGCGHRPYRIARVDEVCIVAWLAVEMFTKQLESQIPGEHPRAVAVACRVGRLAVVAAVVEHRHRELAVMAPGAPVEVGATHRSPDIVEDGHLRV